MIANNSIRNLIYSSILFFTVWKKLPPGKSCHPVEVAL